MSRDDMGLLCGKTRLRCLCGSPAQSILQVNGTHSFPFCGNNTCEQLACGLVAVGVRRALTAITAVVRIGENGGKPGDAPEQNSNENNEV